VSLLRRAMRFSVAKKIHGLSLYKSKTNPCRCKKCREANAKHQREYRRRTGRTKSALISLKALPK
jgi:hypothetical protein